MPDVKIGKKVESLGPRPSWIKPEDYKRAQAELNKGGEAAENMKKFLAAVSTAGRATQKTYQHRVEGRERSVRSTPPVHVRTSNRTAMGSAAHNFPQAVVARGISRAAKKGAKAAGKAASGIIRGASGIARLPF